MPYAMLNLDEFQDGKHVQEKILFAAVRVAIGTSWAERPDGSLQRMNTLSHALHFTLTV